MKPYECRIAVGSNCKKEKSDYLSLCSKDTFLRHIVFTTLKFLMSIPNANRVTPMNSLFPGCSRQSTWWRACSNVKGSAHGRLLFAVVATGDFPGIAAIRDAGHVEDMWRGLVPAINAVPYDYL